MIEPFAGARRYRDDRHALDLRQHAIDQLAQPLANVPDCALDQIDLVEADDDGATFALDEIGNPDVLLLERRLRIDEDDHHFGKTDGVERVGDREFLELLLDARAAAQSGGIVDAQMPPAPVQIDRNRIARDAGFRPGHQPLFAEQSVDQRGLAGIGTPDHGDADRLVGGFGRRGLLVGLVGLCGRLAAAPREARRKDPPIPHHARR